MNVLLKVVASAFAMLILNACGNLGAEVAQANLKFGDSRQSVLQRLGAPNREEKINNFTVLRYCNTDDAGVEGDALYDFVLADDFLIYQTNYSNTRLGMCDSFFRPIDWSSVEPNYQRYLQVVEERSWEIETYNIDLLKVTTKSKRGVDFCDSGTIHEIIVEGQISPDSSFAMSRLLDRLQPCTATTGKGVMPVTVSLKSGGGLLEDGYLMGEIFRQRNVTTVVEDGEACASSCAVAFLGGKKRIVEDSGVIMYHAPYFTGENLYGKRDIDCEVGDAALSQLNTYYRKMTDAETGDRLFERTMWYCSAEDGWVVTGGAAAELYGIATER